MIDLREKDRQAICAIAEKLFANGTEIWAYGSRVKGTNHDTSDLDLVVHFPPEQDRNTDYENCLYLLKRCAIPIFQLLFR